MTGLQLSRPLRIGFDLSKAFGASDGIASYTRSMLRALVELASGDQIVAFDLATGALDPVRLGELVGEPSAVRTGQARLPVKGEIDIFHSPAFELPPFRGCPLVFTLYDLTVISHPECHTLENRAVALSATALAAASASMIIAISEHTRRQAIELLKLPAERMAVVHLAADPRFRRAADPLSLEGVRRRFGIDGPYVLAVGSLEPRKNLIGLVEAMLALPHCRRQDLALVVVGAEGWRNQEILQRLDEVAGELRIYRLGCVDFDDLVVLYNHTEVFVYPSLAEGFGLPVLEAMACGAPVVTSKVSSLPEVAGEAALLVDPRDPEAIASAIKRVVEDTGLRDQLRRRGLERAAEFSWHRCAAETLKVYRQVAD